MTSSVPADAASVWRLRTELKPHYQDGLLASADSDFYVLLVSFRALLNRALSRGTNALAVRWAVLSIHANADL